MRATELDHDFKSVIKATSNKTKKDKKKNKRLAADDAEDDAVPQGEPEADSSISKNPVEMTAEDLADEEWGPLKGKKGKKAKGKKGKTVQDEDDEDVEGAEGIPHVTIGIRLATTLHHSPTASSTYCSSARKD